MRTTYVSFVIDSSGSMQHLVGQVKDTFDSLLKPLRESGEDVRVSVYQFDSTVKRQEFIRDVHSIRPIYMAAGGMTALFDAIHKATNDLLNVGDFRQNSAYLLVVLADGMENASKMNAGAFESLMESLERRNNWTVTFQLPPNTADGFVNRYGISRENVREWESTVRGYQETTQITSSALNNYMIGRSLGATQTKSFYHVTTDLSQVTKRDLSQLDDVSHRFNSFDVLREEEIRPFVERQTGGVYIPGTAFYQLTKPEVIQSTKQVLVKEKTGRKVFGGPEARGLVGLRDFEDGKVKPGNHANFDIFIQSTSTNRKLVRGTKVMVVK